jgi:hypothetical protein
VLEAVRERLGAVPPPLTREFLARHGFATEEVVS